MTAAVAIDQFGRAEGEVATLVRSAAAGDERAWDALVTRYERLVWGIARAHRLARADAADVAQTTWMRLLEHIGGLAAPEHVGAWLATTARRECLRRLSAGRREAPTSPDDLHMSDALAGAGAATATSVEDEVESRLMRTERSRAVERALGELPARQQALLRMLACDPEPSYEEISAALDMPIGSIGPTRARAIARLRKELDRAGQRPEEAVGQPAATGSGLAASGGRAPFWPCDVPTSPAAVAEAA